MMMIINQVKVKRKNLLRTGVHHHLHRTIIKIKNIIIKNIVVVHHHHHPIHLNHVHKKRKNLLIIVNILNIINRKNTMIDGENISLIHVLSLLCTFFCKILLTFEKEKQQYFTRLHHPFP